MTVAFIILALVLAYTLFILGSLGTLDTLATTVWEDAKAIPESLAEGCRLLAGLALLAILMSICAVAVFGRWLWSRHPGERVKRARRGRGKRGIKRARKPAAAEVTS